MSYANKKENVIQSDIFFDAKNTHYSVGDRTLKYDGDVVAITAGLLISADELFVDQINKTFDARGHVVVLSNEFILIAEYLRYHMDSHLFQLEKGQFRWGANQVKDDFQKKILGLTLEEEKAKENRKKHFLAIAPKKELLKEAYIRPETNIKQKELIINQYASLLQKEMLFQSEKTLSLFLEDKKKRELYNLRRSIWNKKAGVLDGEKKNNFVNAYFQLAGDSIIKIDEYTYQSKQALLTFCRCPSDSSPAWGIRASKVRAQIEGYADLHDAVFEVKGIPILYLPYFKFPLKSERQAGLLSPTVSKNSQQETSYSQSLFIPLGAEQDLTIKAAWLQNRGVKVGSDYRLQHRQDSAWEFGVEVLRDRKWLSQKMAQEKLAEVYKNGFEKAKKNLDETNRGKIEHALEDPNWWKRTGYERCLLDKQNKDCLEKLLKEELLPSNNWRGKIKWQGSSYLTSRLSLASEGSYISDHRYNQELSTPTIDQLIGASVESNVYEPLNIHLNLAQNDYFLSLGAEYADPVLLNEKFAGYQLPFVLKFRSRYFPLFSSIDFFKIYSQLQFDHKTIRVDSSSQEQSLLSNQAQLMLGNAHWQKFKLSSLAPISTKTIFLMDYVLDVEGRRIDFSTEPRGQFASILPKQLQKNKGETYLASLRTGLVFTMPMKGFFLWSDKIKTEKQKTVEELRTLEHRMNWKVEFSYRPFVYKKGDYTSLYSRYENSSGQWNKSAQSVPLTYFITDRTDFFNNSYHYDKEILYEHRKLIFSTDHQLFFHNQRKEHSKELLNSSSFDFKTRARKELSLGLSDLSKEIGADQYENKVSISNTEHQLMSLTTTSSYDFVKARERRYLLLSRSSLREELGYPQPWSPLITSISTSWSPFTFNFSNTYNFYKKMSTANNLAMSLTFPAQSTISYTRKLIKDFKFDLDDSYLISESYETHYVISTGVIPHVAISYNLGVKTNDTDLKDKFSHTLSFTYIPPSDCWGIKFLWEKKFEEPSNRGTYYLALIVKSFGETNEFGNLIHKLNT